MVRFRYLLEEEESWETLDSVFLGELGLSGGINLGKGKGWVVLGQNFGGGRVLWVKFLAMSAPWGVELNEEMLMLGKLFVKVGISKDEDSLIKLSSENRIHGCCNNRKEKTNLLHFSWYLYLNQ